MSQTRDATAAAIHFDRAKPEPLFQQIAESIRVAIVTQRLRPGTRLPSTRTLAETLHLARNTVSLAYDDLITQGYLESLVGSGTYVTQSLPEDLLLALQVESQNSDVDYGVAVSRRGSRLASLPVSQVRQPRPPRLFRPGVPGIDQFPKEVWLKLSNQAWRDSRTAVLGYGQPQGHVELRSAIAEMLSGARAIRCSAEQVVVVSGSQQALYLASTVLLDEGDEVWIEDPARTAARSVFRATGQRLVPVPLDEDGLIVEVGRRRAPGARLVYVSPSSQFPTGVHMSIARRLELLSWVNSVGTWVIEDDYDSEYRYAGKPLPALQSLTTASRVIYSGTFSHSTFPSLRLGYLVVPTSLVESFARARALFDRHSPLLDQMTLARFITDGHYDRHQRRMRRHYALRQEALMESAAKFATDLLEIRPAKSGMHVIADILPDLPDVAVEQAVYDVGVDSAALSRFTIEATAPDALVLGYALADELAIQKAMRRLSVAMRKMSPS